MFLNIIDLFYIILINLYLYFIIIYSIEFDNLYIIILYIDFGFIFKDIFVIYNEDFDIAIFDNINDKLFNNLTVNIYRIILLFII